MFFDEFCKIPLRLYNQTHPILYALNHMYDTLASRIGTGLINWFFTIQPYICDGRNSDSLRHILFTPTPSRGNHVSIRGPFVLSAVFIIVLFLTNISIRRIFNVICERQCYTLVSVYLKSVALSVAPPVGDSDNGGCCCCSAVPEICVVVRDL